MAITMKMIALPFATLLLAMTANAQLTPAEEGRRLFLANNCYGCHGLHGEGGSFVGAPNLRTGEYDSSNLSDVLREGKSRGMPAFPKLFNNTDINYLYAYMQSLGTPEEPTFNVWWEPVPTARIPLRARGLYAAMRAKGPNLPRP